MHDVVIRPPHGAEAAAVRLLLGSSYGAGFQALVASVPRPPFIAGAAAWRRLADRADSLHVEVAPSCRRQGVGSALVEAACALARQRNGSRIEGWTNTPEGEAFARSAGFSPAARFTSATTTTTLIQRLVRYDIALPEGLRAVPFTAYRSEVARTWEAEISAGPRAHGAITGDYDDLSVCIVDHEGKLAGFVLARDTETAYHVAGIWVAPEHRNTGALVYMSRAALASATPGRLVRFEWLEHQQWTRRSAELIGAKVESVRTLFARDIALSLERKTDKRLRAGAPP